VLIKSLINLNEPPDTSLTMTQREDKVQRFGLVNALYSALRSSFPRT